MNNDTEEKVIKTTDIPVGISTAVCTHIPEHPFHHIGQMTKCKLCGQVLLYSNNPPGSKKRVSKKERRYLKAQTKGATK